MRRWPLRRGIDPSMLLAQVRNTAPFLFGEDSAPEYVERLRAYRGEELSHEQYFLLACCAHWATAGTFVPTDVDNAIRLKLWQMDEATLEVKLAMADMTIRAAAWDYRPVTARIVTAPDGQVVSMHEGTWFSVAVGAYAALRSLAREKAEEVLETMWREAVREDAVWRALLETGDKLQILKASALLAHNFGDLDRVADMWGLRAGDDLYDRLYDAAKPGTKLFEGRLGRAGELNQRTMAPENHRYLALREPRFLRQKRELMLPVGPFLDEWGGRVAKEKPEHVGECASALLYGMHRTPGSVGYARALAGILEAFPGGMSKLGGHMPSKDARTMATGEARTLTSVPRARFELQWANKVDLKALRG